jgi:AcrR family transcriptional regulator
MKLSRRPMPRHYRQTARAEAAEATRRRILDAFERRFNGGWYDEVHLHDVAREAGVTVQTVIRRFGGKDGLLGAVNQPSSKMQFRRSVAGVDRASIVRAVIDDYEAFGDYLTRLLAQEERYPSLRPMADFGRAGHRAWIAKMFAGELAGLPEGERRRRVDGLVVALDFYVWKLVRRDMKRPIKEVQELMERLVDAVISAPKGRP